MNDRPTAAELIEAVRRFLSAEVAPAVGDARLRFGVLIAAHVLGVAGREVETEEAALIEEWAELAALLGTPEALPARLSDLRSAVRRLNERTVERIRAGGFDEPGAFRRAAAVLRRGVERKLETTGVRQAVAGRA
jgi:hypothetical protein